MAANLEYTFRYIAANAGASVFIHGYGSNEAVNYSATVYGQPAAGVLNPLSKMSMKQDVTYYHVNNTVARLIEVQNLAPFNPCTIRILIQRESF